ncbi:MAG: S8 family serine peptidase [Bacteroidota bacterium]
MPHNHLTVFIIVSFSLAFTACKKEEATTKVETPALGCSIQISNDNGKIIDGQYIIALKPSAGSREIPASNMKLISDNILSRNSIALNSLRQAFTGEPGGFIAKLTADELQKLKNDPSIDKIENDRIIALGDCFSVVEPRLITWNVKRVGYGDGTGKTAWIIDSGIDFSHPDLNVDTVRSHSFLPGVPSARDENGHGTHVAGIIGAKNNSIGVLGVASGANLVSLRTLDKDGVGTMGAMVQALAYVNVNGKAGDVVNISSGEDSVSDIIDQQVRNTAARGIFIAIAAGNDGKPAVHYTPGRANAPNIYTVSAIDSLDKFASFSDFGNDVIDYAAPGVDIVSTWIGGKYARASGTSMAAPHVAGLLLLVGSSIKTSGYALNDPDGTADPIAHD